MNLIDVPDWAWRLLDAVHDFEECHPILYQMTDEGEYTRTECLATYLTKHRGWAPPEIRDAAEFRRHLLAEEGA